MAFKKERGLTELSQRQTGTEGIIYTLSDDGTYAIVTGYNGSATELEIARTYQGVPVTAIGANAFYEKTNITSISLPDTIVTIGEWSFHGCEALTSISLQEGILSIGDYAFDYCESLPSIKLPETLTTIGYCAFSYCYQLAEIVIPDAVTVLNDYTFRCCESLTKITLGTNISRIGENVFMDSALTDVYYKGSESDWSEIAIHAWNAELEQAQTHFNS